MVLVAVRLRRRGPSRPTRFCGRPRGGEEGPATPDEAPPYAAVEGGDAFEMVVAACNPDDYDTDASTLEEAVAHGRMNLAAGG